MSEGRCNQKLLRGPVPHLLGAVMWCCCWARVRAALRQERDSRDPALQATQRAIASQEGPEPDKAAQRSDAVKDRPAAGAEVMGRREGMGWTSDGCAP